MRDAALIAMAWCALLVGCAGPGSPRQPAIDPMLDTDGDTVPDVHDPCPNTQRGMTVAPNGCAIYVGDNFGYSVHYASGGTAITAEFVAILNELVTILKRYPELGINRVEGHADTCTDLATSRRLAQARMESVIRYLLDHGVQPNQIGPKVNFGNTHPFEPTGTSRPDCENLHNNRVQLVYNPPVRYVE